MRTGVIGLGVVGNVHLAVLKKWGMEITALCDTDTAALEQARAAYAPEAAVFTQWQQLLSSGKVDVVHICTPHYLHAGMVLTALAQNIHVLCEKPLCMRPEEIAPILEAERRSRAILGVCHQNRYNAANRFAKEFLADKTVTAAHGSVVWGRDAAYYAQAPWRGTKDQEGGGVLINQALHTLDLMQWLCGMPTEATASVSNLSLQGAIEVEDTVSAVYRGKDTHFTFFATNAGTTDLPVQIRLKLSDGKKMTVLPDSVTLDGDEIFRKQIVDTFGKPCYGSGHEILINDFYAHAAAGRPFPLNGAEGSKVMQLIFAAYQSGGHTIRV